MDGVHAHASLLTVREAVEGGRVSQLWSYLFFNFQSTLEETLQYLLSSTILHSPYRFVLLRMILCNYICP